jgi:hypothetical protein
VAAPLGREVGRRAIDVMAGRRKCGPRAGGGNGRHDGIGDGPRVNAEQQQALGASSSVVLRFLEALERSAPG